MNLGRSWPFLLAVCFHLIGIPQLARAQWIAFNDHAAGDGTHLNATAYHIVGGGDGTNGFLKNVLIGETLPVTLSLSRSGLVLSETLGAQPAPLTPLHEEFDGYVDFSGSPNPNVGLTASGRVYYTLAGLDPSKHYRLTAGAVRGGDPTYIDRWTLCELIGADSYENGHSAGVLTSIQVAELADHQAAINAGMNHTAETGDLISWMGIDPGPDGVIELVCSKYSGMVPGGSSSGIVGYALTGLQLEEYLADMPPTILEQPTNQIVEIGQSASFTVIASAESNGYQWFRNGEAIPGAKDDHYTLASPILSDSGSRFSVSISNQFGGVQSDEVILIVNAPPWTPVPFDHVWRYDDSGANLGTMWTEPSYDDSLWPEGPGALGFETSSLPEPIRTPLTGHNEITYYFRTTFVVTNLPREHAFQVEHLIDDGAVFYLNGAEWFRVGMPLGEIDWQTIADRTVRDARLESMALPQQRLSLGTNWLAVEVHQRSSGNNDLVFGLSVTTLPVTPTPLSITDHPADTEVHRYQPATFGVGVSGDVVNYQWFKDGMAIDGATEAALQIPVTDLTDVGEYLVTVSNAWSFLHSESAMLTVAEPTPVQIVSQPQNQATLIAEPVTFDVEISGDTPYYVQWFKDGEPLVGASSATYTLPVPHLPDAGIYSVLVSNNFSMVMGDPFTLDVNRNPRGEPGSLHQDFVASFDHERVLLTTITRQMDGRILVAPGFNSINGFSRLNLARLSQDGLIDETFRSDVNGSIWVIHECPNGDLLLGGGFVSINGISRTNIALVHPNGSLNPDFKITSSIPRPVRDIAFQGDGKIIAVGGGNDGELSQYFPDGNLEFSDRNTVAGSSGGAFYNAVAVQQDGGILLGGRFTAFHDKDFAHLIRLHGNGELDESFLSGSNAPNGTVHAIQIHQNRILVSGFFSSVAGVERSGIARLKMDGSIDPTFVPPKLTDVRFSPVINHFVLMPNNQILIVGGFNSVGGVSRGGIALLNQDGSLDVSFHGGIGAGPEELSRHDIQRASVDLNGDIYLAGYFTEFNGESRVGLAKLYGKGIPILDWRRTSQGNLEILWPGDRDDLLLESSESVAGYPWTQVAEPTNKVQELNSTTIVPSSSERIFRLRVP